MKKTIVYRGLLGVVLAITLTNSMANQGIWKTEKVTFNGEERTLVAGFSEVRYGVLFHFTKDSKDCMSGISLQFPIPEPSSREVITKGKFCSLVVDDGKARKTHTFGCLFHANKGDNYLTVLIEAPNSSSYLPLMKDVQNASRIGFSSNTDLAWHDARGLEGQLKQGYGYCGKALP